MPAVADELFESVSQFCGLGARGVNKISPGKLRSSAPKRLIVVISLITLIRFHNFNWCMTYSILSSSFPSLPNILDGPPPLYSYDGLQKSCQFKTELVKKLNNFCVTKIWSKIFFLFWKIVNLVKYLSQS